MSTQLKVKTQINFNKKKNKKYKKMYLERRAFKLQRFLVSDNWKPVKKVHLFHKYVYL